MILRIARDLKFRHQILRHPAGVAIRKGVIEPVAQHRVEDLSIAHAIAPAPAAHEVGRGVHVLHAAGDRRIGGRQRRGRGRARGMRCGGSVGHLLFPEPLQ